MAKSHRRTVAMESTGVYWIPAYEVLEQRGFEVVLVNARDAKHVPGRKTDVSDAQWLRRLHEYGLLRGSFHPQCRSAGRTPGAAIWMWLDVANACNLFIDCNLHALICINSLCRPDWWHVMTGDFLSGIFQNFAAKVLFDIYIINVFLKEAFCPNP
jgi:Transposase